MTTTYTGRFLAPRNYGVPTLIDIAVQLGRIARFAGATGPWWSVLHHLRVVHELGRNKATARELGFPDDIAEDDTVTLYLLLHDAEEVATSDVPSLWKPDELRAATAPLMRRIHMTYVGEVPGEMAAKYVKAIDLLALAAEARMVGPSGVFEHSGLVCNAWNPALLRFAETVVETVRIEWDGCSSSAEALESELPWWFLRALKSAGVVNAYGEVLS